MTPQTILSLIFLLALTQAMFTSPNHYKSLGIDISDGVLKEQSDYKVTLSTSCNQLNLNKSGTAYNYSGVAMSGYLSVNKGNSVLSFIFYGKEGTAKDQVKNQPTILWLNGGPGSSSQLGNMFELGPFRIGPSASQPFNITRNPYAWTSHYNILFVDQPVGTGLSYADPTASPSPYVTNMTQLANDFYYALNELYQTSNGCFNKLGITGSSTLFVFGESYGGKYAPAISEKILRQAKQNKGFLTGLKGVAIGDGFTSPFSTLSMMGQYAYNFGLLDYQQRSKIQQYILNATYQNMNHRYKDLHVSFYQVLESITNSTNVNVYDMTKYQNYPTNLLNTYFDNAQVLDMYKLDPSIKYDKQHSNVGEALYEDFMRSQVDLVVKILNGYDVKMIVYTGQNDIICNTPGTLRWLENTRYIGSQEFRETLMSPWKINNEVKGFTKRVGKLQLRTINNGGHLIPMDQGQAALHMVDKFVEFALQEEATKDLEQ